MIVKGCVVASGNPWPTLIIYLLNRMGNRCDLMYVFKQIDKQVYILDYLCEI